MGRLDQLHTDRRRLEPLSPRSLLPAASSYGPRTTSDVVAVPREMHGARTIGVGSKPDAGGYGTVLSERAGVSPFSLTNHDAPWSSNLIVTSDVGVRVAKSTRHSNGPVSMKRGRIPWRARRPRPFVVFHRSA